MATLARLPLPPPVRAAAAAAEDEDADDAVAPTVTEECESGGAAMMRGEV